MFLRSFILLWLGTAVMPTDANAQPKAPSTPTKPPTAESDADKPDTTDPETKPEAAKPEDKLPVLRIPACEDFEVNGKGDAQAWKSVEWVPMNRRNKGVHKYETKFKMLYSKKGVYVLFYGADKKVTATLQKDFLDLWEEDVFECFFWPDETVPIYFEYEISPLGFELPILVPNLNGKFLGWRPWHYEGERKTKKAVVAFDGDKPIEGGAKSGAKITAWQAEVFIPYALLDPLSNVPPKSGTKWRANFFRVDYDNDTVTGWDWSRVGSSFHDVKKYGTLEFE